MSAPGNFPVEMDDMGHSSPMAPDHGAQWGAYGSRADPQQQHQHNHHHHHAAPEESTEDLIPIETAPPRQDVEDEAEIADPPEFNFGDRIMNFLGFLGIDAPWSERPGYEYVDEEQYVLDPSATNPKRYRRCDAALTKDGKRLEKLRVMSTKQIKGHRCTTWYHRNIPDTTTYMFFLSRCPARARVWAMDKWGYPAGWGCWFLAWIVSVTASSVWLALLIVWKIIKFFFGIKRNTDYDLGYESFAYDNKRYALAAANPTENRQENERKPYNQGGSAGPYRLLKPHTLVHVERGKVHFAANDPVPPYVFIAWYSEHFGSTPAMWQAYENKVAQEPNPEWKNMIQVDFFERELRGIAVRATEHYEESYYYLSCYCNGKGNSGRTTEDDIYAMSDIVRGACKVVIVLPDPGRYPSNPTLLQDPCPPLSKLRRVTDDDQIEELPEERLDRLREWGRRAWTYPEVILGPDEAIGIFWKDGKIIKKHALFKQDFPGYVWQTKAMESKELLESFKNTHMTPLEFLKVCLSCLMDRSYKKEHEGDLSYVLMGFVRIRPPIKQTDSAFQAFARLSLPADNNQLMERLICLEPASYESWRWESMSDGYNIDLWNIKPRIQVSAVGENDTVFISSAVGAKIELQNLADVSADALEHRMRSLLGILAGFWPEPMTARLATQQYLRRRLRQTKPRLFAFQGLMELNQIEEKLFGAYIDLLKWNPHGSTLSKHREAEETTNEPDMRILEEYQERMPHPDGERGDGRVALGGWIPRRRQWGARDRITTYHVKGITPWDCSRCPGTDWTPTTCDHNEGRAREFRACGISAMGEQKIYTLIDTVTMTVTVFKAAWPPQVVIACGTEGGLERVLACSYDWTTGTFYREAVLRFPGKVLEYMHRLPSVRLGLKRVYLEGSTGRVQV